LAGRARAAIIAFQVGSSRLPGVLRLGFLLGQLVLFTGGIGLGLAIAQRAVKPHGGEIKAKNRTGGGLEVAIRFPVSSSAALVFPSKPSRSAAVQRI
jgi:signal transduction histidine kinase